MKILQINSVANTGSTGRISENIGLVLQDNGHESYLAFGRPSPKSKLSTIRIGKQFDIYAHGLKTLLTDKHGFGSKRATEEFIKSVDKLKPDAIGLHNLHGYYVNIEILFKYLKESKIPVFWTLHDCWPFTGHCAYYDTVGCERWKSQCEKCPSTKAYPRSLVDNSTFNFNRKKELFLGVDNLTIITPSLWLKKQVEQSFLRGYKISVIHNGVNLALFRSSMKNSIENKVILGVASIWDRRKGLKDFYQLRNLLDDKFSIVLIGLSKKQIDELPRGIKGIERTETQEELINWYNKAFCFVNPTYQDNFPTTNIEALACGTPVITYKTGGSPEAIDEKTGRVVDKGDIEGLVNAIHSFSALSSSEVGQNCRKRAERMFDQKKRYKDYLMLYESIRIK